MRWRVVRTQQKGRRRPRAESGGGGRAGRRAQAHDDARPLAGSAADTVRPRAPALKAKRIDTRIDMDADGRDSNASWSYERHALILLHMEGSLSRSDPVRHPDGHRRQRPPSSPSRAARPEARQGRPQPRPHSHPADDRRLHRRSRQRRCRLPLARLQAGPRARLAHPRPGAGRPIRPCAE
jgi:hypothetical protein